MKVHAPNPAFSGTTVGVVFKDGVADFDPKQNGAAEAYFRRRGFGLGKPAELPAAPGTDARHVTQVRVGAPLRDAAVDPEPEDFLPPTNAGEADPHGLLVVSPEIHGPAGPKGIRPGPVAVDDPARQSAQETELAQAVLVDQVPVPVATSMAVPERPAVRAPATDWRDFAVAQGLDPIEAAETSKEKLIARYGG